ncbi:hypothetical protein UFOVP841_30 [uncultured Caudovirales phage]|uniref:Uncharacterized protein n=1 Tax=uncultured Caudovirales phage TaxID=2100421 RepID=A0A6J5P2V6_9CAUD|nr:hypothetical protein UFOVP841_30 [uncultured Caudovirales phage]
MSDPTQPESELEDDGYAHSRIYMGQRLMLLCHKHALALIDLADGNGVQLRIERLEIEDFGEQCRACMAAEPEPDTPQIILQ